MMVTVLTAAKMLMKKKVKLTAWSYSRLGTYIDCAFKAFLKYIQKLPDPPNAPMMRGATIHTEAEEYLRGYKSRIPKSLMKLAPLFRSLLKIRKSLQIECELAFNKHWESTSWFGKDAWVRIKADVMYDDPKDDHIRHIYDWKTGRIQASHEEQLELYAIAAFLTAPTNITRVDAHLAYTNDGTIVSKTFMWKQLAGLQKKWAKKAKPLLNDMTYRPTPSVRSCKYCPWTAERGGPCKF